MAQPFIGQITIFAGDFAPTGWFLCDGQLLPIQSYTPLFSIIGTYYGGDGVRTFQLPNLQGRAPLGWGQGAGLSTYVIGQAGGVEDVSLLVNNMPSHTHLVNADASFGNSATPSNALLAETVQNRGTTAYDTYATGTPGHSVTLNPAMIQPQGGNIAHTNLQPYLAISYIIAYQGIFPSRG